MYTGGTPRVLPPMRRTSHQTALFPSPPRHPTLRPPRLVLRDPHLLTTKTVTTLSTNNALFVMGTETIIEIGRALYVKEAATQIGQQQTIAPPPTSTPKLINLLIALDVVDDPDAPNTVWIVAILAANGYPICPLCGHYACDCMGFLAKRELPVRNLSPRSQNTNIYIYIYISADAANLRFLWFGVPTYLFGTCASPRLARGLASLRPPQQAAVSPVR